MASQRLNEDYCSSPLVVTVVGSFTAPTSGFANITAGYGSYVACNAGQLSLKIGRRTGAAAGIYDIWGFDAYANNIAADANLQATNATTAPSVLVLGTFWTPYSSSAATGTIGSQPGGTLTVFTGSAAGSLVAQSTATELLQVIVTFNDTLVP